MRAFPAVLGLVLFLPPGAVLSAPGVSLEIPGEVKPAGEYASFIPKTNAKSVVYVGLSGADPLPSDLLRDQRTFLFPVRGLAAGRYKFAAVGALADEQTRVDFVVLVGESPPGPTPPVPPVPPTPTPGANLRVVIFEETADRSKLPAAQLAVLFDKRVRDYLDSKCVAGSKGKEWGIYDVNTDLSQLSKEIQDLKKTPPASLPWLSISSDKGTFGEPLPKTVEETLTLLKKYGG